MSESDNNNNKPILEFNGENFRDYPVLLNKKNARNKYIKRIFEYILVFGMTFFGMSFSLALHSTFFSHIDKYFDLDKYFPNFLYGFHAYPIIGHLLFSIIWTLGYHIIVYIW